MSPAGLLSFTRTRFKNKETKETAYLLDRVLGLFPHVRMSDGVKAAILEEAVQTSYEKAGNEACPGEYVSRETVMRHVRSLRMPAKSQEEPGIKKKTRELYVEADEDHAALQFHKKKVDIKRFKGHADNTQIVKLVYIHEGYKDVGKRRKELKNAVYFGGLYHGKDNGRLWDEVKKYTGSHYVPEETEEERYFSATEMLAWEKRHRKANGKYIEALRASISSKISAKIFFNGKDPAVYHFINIFHLSFSGMQGIFNFFIMAVKNFL